MNKSKNLALMGCIVSFILLVIGFLNVYHLAIAPALSALHSDGANGEVTAAVFVGILVGLVAGVFLLPVLGFIVTSKSVRLKKEDGKSSCLF